MFEWFDSDSIPHDRRLGGLKQTMLGAGSASGGPHSGAQMFTQAAESGILLKLSRCALGKYGRCAREHEDLRIAAGSLLAWVDVRRDASVRLTAREYQVSVGYVYYASSCTSSSR
eukprot:6490814-Pyramimonas_sp.AAC.1